MRNMKYIFWHRNDFSFCFVNRNIFPVRQRNHFSCDTQGVLTVIGFVPPLAMNLHPMCTGSIFPVIITIFLVTEISFLMRFGSSVRCITFSRQMRGIYNQNFV